jgi:hypothetical protein
VKQKRRSIEQQEDRLQISGICEIRGGFLLLRKINAAQASHPGRMLVDVSFTPSLPNAARRLFETAFAEERSFLGAPFKSSVRGPESTLDDSQ